MISRHAPIRLIVNADDFGISESANRAIERAHREGILTSASLMVAGDAAEGAVQIARANPQLGVWLAFGARLRSLGVAPDRDPRVGG